MKCKMCDGYGTLPTSQSAVTFKNGIHLTEGVCNHCFNGEIPGQSEYWLCRCGTEEPVFLFENDGWYYYEPGNGWILIKRGVVPIRRMVEK